MPINYFHKYLLVVILSFFFSIGEGEATFGKKEGKNEAASSCKIIPSSQVQRVVEKPLVLPLQGKLGKSFSVPCISEPFLGEESILEDTFPSSKSFGEVEVTFGEKGEIFGSGVLISSYHVLVLQELFHPVRERDVIYNVTFSPGKEGSAIPNGQYTPSSLLMSPDGKNPFSILVFETPFGEVLGWSGIRHTGARECYMKGYTSSHEIQEKEVGSHGESISSGVWSGEGFLFERGSTGDYFLGYSCKSKREMMTGVFLSQIKSWIAEYVRILFNDLGDFSGCEGFYKRGLCYGQGYGVEQDYEEAFKYYKKSGEKGCYSAMWMQALCLIYGGMGCEKNKEKGKSLLKLGQQKFPLEKPLFLWTLNTMEGTRTRLNLSNKAEKLLNKEVKKGNVWATYFLGYLNFVDKRAPRVSLVYLKRAADQGVLPAAEFIPDLFPYDMAAQIKYLKRAQEMGSQKAVVQLAKIYIKKNFKQKAVNILLTIALKYGEAAWELSEIYREEGREELELKWRDKALELDPKLQLKFLI